MGLAARGHMIDSMPNSIGDKALAFPLQKTRLEYWSG